jgi:hypothetical protein
MPLRGKYSSCASIKYFFKCDSPIAKVVMPLHNGATHWKYIFTDYNQVCQLGN